MAKSTAVKDGRKRGNQLFEKVMLKKEKMQNHVKRSKDGRLKNYNEKRLNIHQ